MQAAGPEQFSHVLSPSSSKGVFGGAGFCLKWRLQSGKGKVGGGGHEHRAAFGAKVGSRNIADSRQGVPGALTIAAYRKPDQRRNRGQGHGGCRGEMGHGVHTVRRVAVVGKVVGVLHSGEAT